MARWVDSNSLPSFNPIAASWQPSVIRTNRQAQHRNRILDVVATPDHVLVGPDEDKPGTKQVSVRTLSNIETHKRDAEAFSRHQYRTRLRR